MTFGAKFGRKSVTWKVSTQGRKYFKLSELIEQYEIGHTYVLDCLYINDKSQYGESPVAGVADAKGSFMVNLPKHLLQQVRVILEDPEAVEAIQLGRAGFKVRTYTPKGSNRICYTVDWCDVELPGDLPF